MSKFIYEIDGASFSTLEEFYDVVTNSLIPGAVRGRNLDAFNDILRGGFGTPDGGFVLMWRNSALSRERLGYSETVRQRDEPSYHNQTPILLRLCKSSDAHWMIDDPRSTTDRAWP